MEVLEDGDAFELAIVGRNSWSPWTARRSDRSILRIQSWDVHWWTDVEAQRSSKTGHLITKSPALAVKRPDQQRKGKAGEGDDRMRMDGWWHYWLNRTWVWVSHEVSDGQRRWHVFCNLWGQSQLWWAVCRWTELKINLILD